MKIKVTDKNRSDCSVSRQTASNAEEMRFKGLSDDLLLLVYGVSD